MDVKKAISGLTLFAVLFAGLGFAGGDPGTGTGGSPTTIAAGICQLYDTVNVVLGAVIFVLIVLAAVVYAAGQVMGAETRARASVWATSMIVGAVIGIIIYVLVPPILNSMLQGTSVSAECTNTGTGAGGGTGTGTTTSPLTTGTEEGVVCAAGQYCAERGPSGECMRCVAYEVRTPVRPIPRTTPTPTIG